MRDTRMSEAGEATLTNARRMAVGVRVLADEAVIEAKAAQMRGLCHVCGVRRGRRCQRDEAWHPPCPRELGREDADIGYASVSPVELKILRYASECAEPFAASDASRHGHTLAFTAAALSTCYSAGLLVLVDDRGAARYRFTAAGKRAARKSFAV